MKKAEHPCFEDHVKAVVHKLRGDLGDLFISMDLNPTRPQDMARHLGLNKNLTWKISRIICETDPYIAIPHVPGKPGMNILLRSMEEAGASPRAIDALRNTLAEFDSMVKIHAGDRATLEMMLGNLTQDGEQQRNESHRKLSYLGNSATWGVQAQVQITTNFIAPDGSGDKVDLAWLSGLVGFRRLRPDVVWAMASARKTADNGSMLPLGSIEAIDMSFSGRDTAPLMGAFCSKPLPEIRTVFGPESRLRFDLVEGPVGNTASATCIIGLFGRSFVIRYRETNDTIGEHLVRLSTPVELLINDLFVHRDLEYAMSPQVNLYSQLPGGQAYPAAGRDRGKLPLHEKLIHLGVGTSGVLTPEFPQYKKMIESVHDRLGWNPDLFHGFRLRMRYPPIPTIAVMQYDLPERL